MGSLSLDYSGAFDVGGLAVVPDDDRPGCEWPIDEGCLGDAWDSLDDDVKARSVTLAVDTLRRLTAYRVGGCPITVRPVGDSCCFVPYNGFDPVGPLPGINVHGQWVNNCGCHTRLAHNEVALPAPVGRVDEVRVDGVVVNPENYRVDEGHLLVWTPQSNPPWNLSQDPALSDSEPGTFSVTYLNAYPVGPSGAYAAGVLANEYAKACSGAKCRLPTGVTTIVRQGITMDLPSGAFPNGMTGIREIDAFIALWNPEQRTQSTRVWSPDLRTARRVGA